MRCTLCRQWQDQLGAVDRAGERLTRRLLTWTRAWRSPGSSRVTGLAERDPLVPADPTCRGQSAHRHHRAAGHGEAGRTRRHEIRSAVDRGAAPASAHHPPRDQSRHPFRRRSRALPRCPSRRRSQALPRRPSGHRSRHPLRRPPHHPLRSPAAPAASSTASPAAPAALSAASPAAPAHIIRRITCGARRIIRGNTRPADHAAVRAVACSDFRHTVRPVVRPTVQELAGRASTARSGTGSGGHPPPVRFVLSRHSPRRPTRHRLRRPCRLGRRGDHAPMLTIGGLVFLLVCCVFGNTWSRAAASSRWPRPCRSRCGRSPAPRPSFVMRQQHARRETYAWRVCEDPQRCDLQEGRHVDLLSLLCFLMRLASTKGQHGARGAHREAGRKPGVPEIPEDPRQPPRLRDHLRLPAHGRDECRRSEPDRRRHGA